MVAVVILLYSLLLFVSLTNLLLMRKPGRRTDGKIAALIPARNEEKNLARLIPTLIEQGIQVFVFDDESIDLTAEVARQGGAIVLRGGPLPDGWTGKNRACHELAKAAAEASDADHWVFLDADVAAKHGFADAMRDLSKFAPVVTGFPQVLPGKGIEPLFLAWVGWILLATNPFGLVSRTRVGHNRFTNGQFSIWRPNLYTEIWPHEKVKEAILEDVLIGRLLAREGQRVEVANVSNVLAVGMYERWQDALDGMSKNSYEITGNVFGTVLLALFLLVLGWAWLLVPWTLVMLFLSGVCVVLICRTVWWPTLLMPIVATIGAYTLSRSLWWRKTGRTVWKGRSYP